MKAPLFLLLPAVTLLSVFPLAADDDLATLQAKVAKGDAQAELELGSDYYNGTGVPQDKAKAADLYRQSAAQGSFKSMFNLGFLYARGEGVTLDIPTAIQWYEKSADRGYAKAQLALGMLYFFGNGSLKPDYAAAAKWLTLAAQQNDAPEQAAPAANTLGAIYESGMAGVPMDGKKCLAFYTQAAELGHSRAQSNLGRLYEESTFVPQDPLRSYIWLKLAKDRGDVTAINLLNDYRGSKTFSAELMAVGNGVAKAYEQKRAAARLARIPLPEPLPPVPAAKATVSATNAAPAAPKPPVIAPAAANVSPAAGAGHSN
jgi:TPR repeat protein